MRVTATEKPVPCQEDIWISKRLASMTYTLDFNSYKTIWKFQWESGPKYSWMSCYVYSAITGTARYNCSTFIRKTLQISYMGISLLATNTIDLTCALSTDFYL